MDNESCVVNSLLVDNNDLYDSPTALITTDAIIFSDVCSLRAENEISINSNQQIKIKVKDEVKCGIDETGLMTDLPPLSNSNLVNKLYVDSLKPILNCNGFSNSGAISLVANTAIFPVSTTLRVDITSISQQVLLMASLITTIAVATANIGMTIGYSMNPTPSTSWINLANNVAFSTTEIAVSNATNEQNNLNTLLCSEFIKDASQGQSLNCCIRFCPTSIGSYYFTMRFVSGTAGIAYFRNCNIISLII